MKQLSPTALGALCATIAVFCFSINDMTIKFLSGSYALHQVVFIRSLIGLTVILCLIAPFTTGRAVFRTRRLRQHLLRGLFLVVANITFFVGLAAMPLADAVAIFFISPVLITLASVVFLGETVGLRRWASILVGLLGVLVMMRPGTDSFQFASILPLISAVFYAAIHITTRKMADTENAVTMAFYIQVVFIGVAAVFYLTVGDGRFGDHPDPSLAFLLREWTWPETSDVPFLLIIGVVIGLAGYLISQAYRVAEASVVAPFEYLALPMSVIWGMVVFGEFPDRWDYLGMVLILGSGLFMIWRDSQAQRAILQRPVRR